MPLKLGAYTACLHDRPLAEALDVLQAEGLTSAEVNTGGFIPSPHCHVDALLASEQARRGYLAEFWVVNLWDGVYLDVLDYQWDVAVRYWTEIDALAQANGVRLAIERCIPTTWFSRRSHCASWST